MREDVILAAAVDVERARLRENRALLDLGAAAAARGPDSRSKETYAKALYKDDKAATLDDLRDAVTTLEEMERNARRRVLGGALNGI